MAIPIFMQIESETQGPIEGGCDIQGREGWMECLEYSHQVYIPTDKTTGALTGTRVHEPLRVTKLIDKASPLLFQHLTTGARLSEVLLHFYRISPEGKEEEYFTIKLEGAQIVSMEPVMLNPRLQENERIPHLERIAFAYKKITWTEAKDHIEHMDDYAVKDA